MRLGTFKYAGCMSENKKFYRIESETARVYAATKLDDRDNFVRGFDGKGLVFDNKRAAVTAAEGYALGRGLECPVRNYE